MADPTTPLVEDFEGFPIWHAWPDGTTHGPWKAVFDGFGVTSVVRDGSRVLALRPRAATHAEETHAALVVSSGEFGDLDLSVRAKTRRQLRVPEPNPWETTWVLWHYRDDTHFLYLALKTNGWELGKEDPAYPGAQRFLATGSTPAFPVGSWHTIRIVHIGAAMTAWVDGEPLTTFIDDERPYLSGAVGFYTEDAVATFDDVVVTAPVGS